VRAGRTGKATPQEQLDCTEFSFITSDGVTASLIFNVHKSKRYPVRASDNENQQVDIRGSRCVNLK
jgi:hypothetical protein